jgi:hypothetical protein
MQVSGAFNRPNVSDGPPRQAAQEAFSVITTPASTNTSISIDLPTSYSSVQSWERQTDGFVRSFHPGV